MVPHHAVGQKKICPGSGKPFQAPEPPQPKAGNKDLNDLMTRDVIKVILCKRNAEPSIEELTLEYLDKSDRVRLQIEALRDMLGPDFRMKPYPAQLGKNDLALWGNAAVFVVARKHERGGYQQMSDADIAAVLEDIRNSRTVFGLSEGQ